MKKTLQILRRKRRVSSNITGTKDRPRISIFRSNKYIYSQAINDQDRNTVAAFSSLKLKKTDLKKVDAAKLVGQELGKILVSKKVKKAVFDRGLYGYQGRVKNLCEGLREAGVKI